MTAPTTTASTTLGCTVDPDEVRSTCTTARQTQVHINDRTRLHLTGDPAHWRLLAKAIEDAAMEAEGSRVVGVVASDDDDFYRFDMSDDELAPR